MRKLIATAAAAAGLLLATTMAGATSTGVTYQRVHGAWDVCVTNGGLASLPSYTKVFQITFGGLATQPADIDAPSGWQGSSMQSGSTWSVTWTATTGSAVLGSGGPFCGYAFRVRGGPSALPASEPVTLIFVTDTLSCCAAGTFVATEI